MAEDMIALEKKINRNFEIYKKDTTKFKEAVNERFKQVHDKIEEKHGLVLKRFAKERYPEGHISPRPAQKVQEASNTELLKSELRKSFSKDRLELNISNMAEEVDKLRDMMRKLSQLTSAEVDQLKDEFENFKKRTAAEVKKAWKEVESHDRELNRQQDMYRSMLSEYYSVLETKKAIDLYNIKMAAEHQPQTNLQDTKHQTMNISHINIGSINLGKTKKNKTMEKRASYVNPHKSLHSHTSKTSKTELKGKFPVIGNQMNQSKLISTTLNFSPSIRNHSEMRGTMKDILSAEEKQYQVLRKFVKHSPGSLPKRADSKSPSEFRPTMLSLQIAANINDSKLNTSISGGERLNVSHTPEVYFPSP